MALTALQIQSTKPGAKNQRLSDGGGLYLLLTTKGQRWWRFDYRFEGKRKTLSLGVYPDVTLRSAREHHQEARRLVAQGIDPSALRQQRKASSELTAANSFGAVATEWFERQKTQWSERHAGRIWRRIEQDILPWLGQRPLHEVRPPEVLQALRRVEERGAIETAHRLLQYCGKIFRYGVATGRIESDPCRDLRGALRPVQETHLAAVTEPHAVALLMRTLHAYEGSLIVRSALQLAPLVFVRPGELRKARWEAID